MVALAPHWETNLKRVIRNGVPIDKNLFKAAVWCADTNNHLARVKPLSQALNAYSHDGVLSEGCTMKAKLNRSTVDRLEPKAKPYDVTDAGLPGFAVRVHPGGGKSYIVRYRLRGEGRGANSRTYTIGKHPGMTPERARAVALDVLAKAAEGIDARTREAKDPTVQSLLDAYAASLKGRPGQPIVLSDVRLHLGPALGRIRVSELRAIHVRRMMDALAAEGKRRRAGACLSVLRTAMTHAGLSTDRLAGLRGHQGRKRSRTASADELRAILRVCREILADGSQWPWTIYLFLLLFLTGARPGEIRTAKWSDYDPERRVIVRREHKTAHKTGEARVIQINDMAAAMLGSMPRLHGNPHIIPGHERGGPLRAYHTAWGTVCRRAGVEGLTVYDIRRTYATIALGRGHTAEQIARSLGHSSLGAVEHYAHLSAEDARRIAQEMGAALAQLAEPPATPQDGEESTGSGPRT